MNKEEQELREKVFQALGKASMCWNPIPSGEFDSSKAQNIGNELIKEIRAILPPRQEVMSEEEIDNLVNQLENLSTLIGLKYDTGIPKHLARDAVNVTIPNVIKALSGRIAKPEPQKPVGEIEELLPFKMVGRQARDEDLVNINHGGLTSIVNKINELVRGYETLRQRVEEGR